MTATRYFLRLSYDGTNFSGWQCQKNHDSIQETIEKALSILSKSPQKIIGCGRTDAGVHAKDYYAHWNSPSIVDSLFLIKLNAILPRTIAIKEVFEVEDKISARFNATNRTYRYYIHTQKNPFLRNHSYEYAYHPLNLEKMTQVAEKLLSYTEFLPLIKLDKEHKKTTCYLTTSKLVFNDEEPTSFYYEVAANRFLHNMVRRIVGTIVSIGRGKMSFEEFVECMDTQTNFKNISLAPANGLHLIKIDYPFLQNTTSS